MAHTSDLDSLHPILATAAAALNEALKRLPKKYFVKLTCKVYPSRHSKSETLLKTHFPNALKGKRMNMKDATSDLGSEDFSVIRKKLSSEIFAKHMEQFVRCFLDNNNAPILITHLEKKFPRYSAHSVAQQVNLIFIDIELPYRIKGRGRWEKRMMQIYTWKK